MHWISAASAWNLYRAVSIVIFHESREAGMIPALRVCEYSASVIEILQDCYVFSQPEQVMRPDFYNYKDCLRLPEVQPRLLGALMIWVMCESRRRVDQMVKQLSAATTAGSPHGGADWVIKTAVEMIRPRSPSASSANEFEHCCRWPLHQSSGAHTFVRLILL